jgi:hypothetical protein
MMALFDPKFSATAVSLSTKERLDRSRLEEEEGGQERERESEGRVGD